MAYVQANFLLTAPYTTPSDELFKRTSSFQESREAELKTYYKTEDACRHRGYLKELLALAALLTSYYERALGMAGASGVTAQSALALSRTPKKPHTPADPPPADTADEQAPAPAGSAGAQEPAPAASPPKAGGKGGVRARGCGK